jgi:hypothetical protein
MRPKLFTSLLIVVGCLVVVMLISQNLPIDWIEKQPKEIQKPGLAVSAESTLKSISLNEQAGVQSAISLNVSQKPLKKIAALIVKPLSINLIYDKEIADQVVDFCAENLTVEEALKKLFSNSDTFFYYAHATDGALKLATVWVYPQGMGDLLSPLPTIAENLSQVTLDVNDPDPDTRARAVESLIRQQVSDAPDILEIALNDTEEKVRLHALNSAAITSMPVSLEKLRWMLREDRSSTIRSMALTMLYQQFEEGRVEIDDVLQALNIAINDQENKVVEIAKQIKVNLNAITLAPVEASEDHSQEIPYVDNPV